MTSSETSPEGGTALLDPIKASKRLGVSLQTLSTWRSRGTGPAFTKLGRLVRYAPADLESFIQAGRRSAASADAA